MKMVKYELAVVHKKDLILTMEEDVDSEEVLKIFLETLKDNQKWIWISCVADVCRRKYKDAATCGIHDQKRSQCIS